MCIFLTAANWLLNAVADRRGVGSAALIRALEPTRGLEIMRARRPAARHDRSLASGPGRLAQALGVSKEHNGAPLWDGPIAIRPAEKPVGSVVVSTRVGISKGARLPLRFYLADNPHVSKRAKADR